MGGSLEWMELFSVNKEINVQVRTKVCEEGVSPLGGSAEVFSSIKFNRPIVFAVRVWCS